MATANGGIRLRVACQNLSRPLLLPPLLHWPQLPPLAFLCFSCAKQQTCWRILREGLPLPPAVSWQRLQARAASAAGRVLGRGQSESRARQPQDEGHTALGEQGEVLQQGSHQRHAASHQEGLQQQEGVPLQVLQPLTRRKHTRLEH